MKKRLTALALCVGMAFSSAAVANAAGFSDLTDFHQWAKPQIEEMTTIGIIKGYTDGTFRPDKAITKTEALVLIARAAGYITEDYELFKTAAFNRYGDVAAAYATPYPKEISYLLYKGVLTEDDLASYIAPDRADSSLLRYEMAILLTKLMRAEGSVSSDVSLDYSDAGEVPYVAAPYVDYVTNVSLMQGVYDPDYPDDIFFKPYGSVTRAQMAVLLHRVLDKFETSVSYATVIGKSTATNRITYRDATGTPSFLSVSPGVNITVDGYAASDVSHIAANAQMALFSINGTLCDVEIVNPDSNRWNGNEISAALPSDPVSGVVSTITFADDCYIVIDDCEYLVSAAASVYVNHIAATLYDLRVGYNAQLTFANGRVVSVYATSATAETDGKISAEGVITKLNLTNRSLYLNVENSETGATSEKLLYIETGASIFNSISGQSIDFLSLQPGDRITASGTLRDGSFYASVIKISVK